MNRKKKYTEEQIGFLREISPERTRQEIVSKFNEKYPESQITVSKLHGIFRLNGFNTGLSGRFEKGNIPHNKGRKVSPEEYERLKATMFKKGNIPKDHRPVGSERVTVDGYIEVKVAEPNLWKMKQRVVYEEAYGPIKKGEIIIFKDSNRKNVNPENLEAITMKTHVILNHKKLRYKDAKLTETGILIAKLIEAKEKKK